MTNAPLATNHAPRYTLRMPDASFFITVKPKAARNAVVVTPEGVVVQVTAPPVDGAANSAVIVTLARALDVPKSRVSIQAGASGRLKRISIRDLSPDDLQARLATLGK
jgi:uncharacterized protein (TIGR00251 family)